jgi:hypothetical protein
MYEICNANLPGMHEAVQASLLAGAVSSFLTTAVIHPDVEDGGQLE